MATVLSVPVQLLVVREVNAQDGGALVHFADGPTGRVSGDPPKVERCLRLLQRSKERQQPVGVSLDSQNRVTELYRADNDVVAEVGEGQEAVTVLFQGHDGVFTLGREHPDYNRLLDVLRTSGRRGDCVWFVAEPRQLALLAVSEGPTQGAAQRPPEPKGELTGSGPGQVTRGEGGAMADKFEYVAELAAKAEKDQSLAERLRQDPVATLKQVAAPPLQSDVWIYRIVVASLGLAVLIAVIAASVLAGLGKSVPEVLVAIGSAAVGALAGLLAPSPVKSAG